jgi:oligoendopeptidase F
MPTLIARRFERSREMPMEQVEALFETVLSPDVMKRVAAQVEKRLGRELRPFDIWYDGFKARSTIGDDRLTEMTRARYPTPDDFRADMPRILGELGFDAETADYLRSKIAVDPSRGAGHASGPGRRDSMARLRTRVLADGMDYKGYNIAVHELGHNVEQVFSTCKIDHTMLAGVPNTAFTEAFAFVFQSRDMALLGVEETDPNRALLDQLDSYWWLCEITAVALVDMRVWDWLYAHPEATPGELQEAVIGIARGVWNEHYAPIIGVRDVPILAVYSHMITGSMYIPDYAIGGIIRYQIEDYLESRNLGAEMERMCLIGSVTPDHWMQQAVGAPISAEPLLEATREALGELEG